MSMEASMSSKNGKQRFSKLREDIIDGDYFEQEKATSEMIDLLKQYPALCADALDMIQLAYDFNDNAKENLLNNIIEIKPKLSIDIIQRFDDFGLDDDYYKRIITNILHKHPNLAEQIIENIKDRDCNGDPVLAEVVTSRPELFSEAVKIAEDENFVIQAFISGKDKLSENDINLIMGEFSYKNLCKLYPEYSYFARLEEIFPKQRLDFIKKVVRGNPNNKEILKKCLLMMQSFKKDENTDPVTNEILTLQPEFKEFSNVLNILKMRITTSSQVDMMEDNPAPVFEYTTGHSDLTQLQNRMILKSDKKNIITSYIAQSEKEKELFNSPEKISKFLNEIDFSDHNSSTLSTAIATIAELTKNEDIRKILLHKKEEAYGNWDYQDIRKIEEVLEHTNYIVDTLNRIFYRLKNNMRELIEAALMRKRYEIKNL